MDPSKFRPGCNCPALWQIGSDPLGDPFDPQFFTETAASAGTSQHDASIAMTPSGSYVIAWTQDTTDSMGNPSNQNLYFRQFSESTVNAGPQVAELDVPASAIVSPTQGVTELDGTVIDPGAAVHVADGMQHLVVSFDTDMLCFDDATLQNAVTQYNAWVLNHPGQAVPNSIMHVLDSVTNINNYVLLKNGAPVPGGIVSIQYGMNEASDLAQLAASDPADYGQFADLNAVPTNHFEAVITFSGTNGLLNGNYTLEALAPTAAQPVASTQLAAAIAAAATTITVRSSAGFPTATAGDPSTWFSIGIDNEQMTVTNTAGTTWTVVRGANGTVATTHAVNAAVSSGNPSGTSGLVDATSQANALGHNGFQPAGANFTQQFAVVVDNQQDPAVDPTSPVNGHTYAESARAVAVDGKGDHIVVWTATDPSSQLDRVFVQIFNADGSDSVLAPAAFAVTATASVPQRYATVACDADGDFVVTWTQFDGANDTNVYARRFNSAGVAQGGAFEVNSYTANNQEWSSVAMDATGDFVVTWSSYGQEDNGQLGDGFGVYARRYDSFGVPVSGEFQVNTTTAGNQQASSVSMADNGTFAIVWESSQSVGGNNIMLRVFNSDGSPQGGPFAGEIMVNTTQTGNHLYPDVAMNLTGTSLVVTWQSSGQDGSGWGVYSRLLDTQAFHPEVLVNTTTAGDQMYPSVAMAYDGSYTISWSGNGSQPNQGDSSGVFYQRFDATGAEVGGETRANIATAGNQWLASVGADSSGNIVVVWTGPGGTAGTTDVYQFVGLNTAPVVNLVGPIVSDVLTPDATQPGQFDRVLNGGSALVSNSGLTQVSVEFDENLDALANPQTYLTQSVTSTATTIRVASTAGLLTNIPCTIVVDNEQMTVTGVNGLTLTVVRGQNSTAKVAHLANATVSLLIDPAFWAHSILNPANWSLYRNGSDITGAIANITFNLDPTTNKYTAVLTINGSGLSGGAAALTSGNYTLVVSANVWDAAQPQCGDQHLLGQRPGRRFQRRARLRSVQHLLLGGHYGGAGLGAPRGRHGRQRQQRHWIPAAVLADSRRGNLAGDEHPFGGDERQRRICRGLDELRAGRSNRPKWQRRLHAVVRRRQHPADRRRLGEHHHRWQPV